ncbi:hypothetical protein H9564_07600 [Limosilactobacillus sp. Sa3CUN2]|uniref:Uncharacterized protein n=1 Tax=Limosilactobacillus avistercoris TaxID=2762243 RepID=A0ABR8PE45_9LACO|nr:hypothetical protein [Limosilactobacillus avistercoris]MBD7895554.1 hypothetical protein [Limosilactobacillus avistercoris]
MEKLVTLTYQRRIAILSQLTAEQVAALNEFTRYALLSQFHTWHYLKNTDWEFAGLVIDPYYERASSHRGENLYCDCGRRLKNQFILRSRSSGRQLKLGITHFQQHASIPEKVAKEIQAGVNEIHLYMDSILQRYVAGHSFPHAAFDYAVKHGGFTNRESTILYQRCQLFANVDLPLYQTDELALRQLVRELKNGTRPRLTRKQILQLKETIATDWRQLEQQLTLIQFQLSEAGVTGQDLHRIKSNGINYALQRRKSRFLIHQWKEITDLTLNKARAQLAIKLRELAFYALILGDEEKFSLQQTQICQSLAAHHISVKGSRSFGVREAQKIIEELSDAS